jgi:hypothetical protein
MASILVILHGYSDTRKSFEPLAAFLRNNGFKVTSIFLGDYITLEDQVTISDLAKAFVNALAVKEISVKKAGIDLIVHSTGALVAREWLTRYFLEPQFPCPLAHFLMLAPANFGSPFGHLGKTMLGRIIKGWKTGFETGTQVLNALELASPYTRQLAERDLFGKDCFYRPDVCMTAVLVGSKPYQTGLRQAVDKNGGDGTVYVCTANLNATGMTIRFDRKGTSPNVRQWKKPRNKIAFGVFPDRDHSSITRPETGQPNLGELMCQFLRLASPVAFDQFCNQCNTLTKTTLPDNPQKAIFNTYQNLVTHVSDDFGYSVADYFLEFYEKARSRRDENKIDELMVHIQAEVLEGVHPCDNDKSYRSLFFNLTKLRSALAEGKKLMFSLSAAPLGRLIGYNAGAANDISELPVNEKNTKFWRPNETLLLDLVIERTQAPKMFKLYAAGSKN